jgi:hypothetical protein
VGTRSPVPLATGLHDYVRQTLAGVEKMPMTSDGTSLLLLAILARAIRDLGHADPLIRSAARLWLREDPLCAEICEVLGYSLRALHRAMGLASPGADDSAAAEA